MSLHDCRFQSESNKRSHVLFGFYVSLISFHLGWHHFFFPMALTNFSGSADSFPVWIPHSESVCSLIGSFDWFLSLVFPINWKSRGLIRHKLIILVLVGGQESFLLYYVERKYSWSLNNIDLNLLIRRFVSINIVYYYK